MVDHIIFMVTTNHKPPINSLPVLNDPQALQRARAAINYVTRYNHCIWLPVVNMSLDHLHGWQITVDIG
jgi:hypothetical protein